jgi:5'-3' exonuclease
MARIGPAEVRERYGVDPEQVPDFIALRGDPSDKLPGAGAVGPKGAADLLKRHGTLAGIWRPASWRPAFSPRTVVTCKACLHRAERSRLDSSHSREVGALPALLAMSQRWGLFGFLTLIQSRNGPDP